MTPNPRRRLRLGCGEALDPVATTALRQSPPRARATWPAGRQMPRLPIGVLSQR